MQNLGKRHSRLLRKDEELQRLFEEANRRRKLKLLSKASSADAPLENNLERQTCILKPLRSTNDIKRDNLLSNAKAFKGVQTQKNTYRSCQNLPETNLNHLFLNNNQRNSSQEISSISNGSFPPTNNNSDSKNESSLSSNNVTSTLIQLQQGHHNPNFLNSSSSDEVDTSKYCQFYPVSSKASKFTTTTSSDTNESGDFLTKSSDFSTLLASLKNDDESRKCQKPDLFNTNDKGRRPSSVYYYPSGSPLLSHKYQGSPVVRIDNKLRAGEADYLLDLPCDSVTDDTVTDVKPVTPVISGDGSGDNYNRSSHHLRSKPPLIPKTIEQGPNTATSAVAALRSRLKIQPVSQLVSNINSAGKICYQQQQSIPMTSASQPVLNREEVYDNVHVAAKANTPTTSGLPSDVSNNTGANISISGATGATTSTLIKRRRKKLLEEHMTKRFSMGDYSTRPLIEWESKLQLDESLNLSTSGTKDESLNMRRQMSTQSDGLYCGSPYTINADDDNDMLEDHEDNCCLITATLKNYSSESNIIQCTCSSGTSYGNLKTISVSGLAGSNSADIVSKATGSSLRASDSNYQQQVSFCESRGNKHKCITRNSPHHHHNHYRHNHKWLPNILQRSLNDIRGAFRNLKSVSSNDKVNSVQTPNSVGTRRKTAFQFKSFKKRDSITSDHLYSIPPFMRRLPSHNNHNHCDNGGISGSRHGAIGGAGVQHFQLDNVHMTSTMTGGGNGTGAALPLIHDSNNFIAQLDPTYSPMLSSSDNNHNGGINSHTSDSNGGCANSNDRYQNKKSSMIGQSDQCTSTKRNRSYRLSFIENAHTVTTRKLTSNNASGGGALTSVDIPPRYVQPRRRIRSKKSSKASQPNFEAKSLSTCAQQ